jgi:hypothetical protein
MYAVQPADFVKRHKWYAKLTTASTVVRHVYAVQLVLFWNAQGGNQTMTYFTVARHMYTKLIIEFGMRFSLWLTLSLQL